ncbi:MAG TPA: hypothetical protein VFQ00_07195 [Terriglobales bacterium]|nr:hypothetical protein [Terriglobales bacterium]
MSSWTAGQTAIETKYSYSEDARLLAITNGSSPDSPVIFRYDENGRKTKIQTSTPADYRPNFGVAGSPFEVLDTPPNRPDGGAATTTYDDQDRPIVVVVRDSQGNLISRATRNYDDNGRIVEEQQILETPDALIPTDLREKILAESKTSLAELRNQLAQLMGGQPGPYSVVYSYDSRDRIIRTIRRVFNREEAIETIYNEHGDKVLEITRDKHIGSADEVPPPRPDQYSEVRYSYEYDERGNWTKETIAFRSSSAAEFQPSTERQRELSYY